MRRLGLFIGILFALIVPATAGDEIRFNGIPTMAPAADEVPLASNGDAQTDALLDCYAKFAGPDLNGKEIGAPHMARSPAFGAVLRADFVPNGQAKAGLTRLLCWSGGFTTQKELTVPPLDASPDKGTADAIAGWRARKHSEAVAEVTRPRLPPPDAQTVRLLEGIWLVGQKPDQGPCLAHDYRATQIEFEFARSGGRALVFEPEDLFTAFAISGIERHGDMMLIQAQTRTGGLVPFLHVRVQSPDSIQLEALSGAPMDIAYKCGEPNRAVTAGVTPERLAALAPAVTGGWIFPAVIEGASDDDVCNGRVKIPPGEEVKWLQIELLGPAHFWIFGWGMWPEHKLAFDLVRKVEARRDGALVLHMQEHSGGWEGTGGKPYTLTVIDHGGRIEIPELGRSFIRCKAGEPGSGGMHRGL
jgi:hypothetical protein